MHIYISNLNSVIGDEELNRLFSSFGEVRSASVVRDVFTGQSKGFAYVEMEDDFAARKAIDNLHLSIWHGQPIYVEEALARKAQQRTIKLGNDLTDVYQFGKN